MSVSTSLLHNDHNIVKVQPSDDRCPVNSFKHYMNLLNPKLDAFFQRPSRDKKKFDNMVLGKGPLTDMMKVISVKAKLSDVYTNHCIRKTTGTAMHKSGASLNEIPYHRKQKNLQFNYFHTTSLSQPLNTKRDMQTCCTSSLNQKKIQSKVTTLNQHPIKSRRKTCRIILLK